MSDFSQPRPSHSSTSQSTPSHSSPSHSSTSQRSPSADETPTHDELGASRLPPLFALGRVGATPGAIEALLDARLDAFVLLERHGRGDWGDELSPDDIQANNDALQDGGRLFSAYQLPKDAGKVWVITEADRSATTLLLPSEY